MMSIKIEGQAKRTLGKGGLTPTVVEQLKESMAEELYDDIQAALDNPLELEWHIDISIADHPTLEAKLNVEVDREE
jgi:hypothetical protein